MFSLSLAQYRHRRYIRAQVRAYLARNYPGTTISKAAFKAYAAHVGGW